MVDPACISGTFYRFTAANTFGVVAVHIGILTGIHLCTAVGIRGGYRHWQDGHNHQNGEKCTQNFRESFCHIVIPFVFIFADNRKTSRFTVCKTTGVCHIQLIW